MVRWAYLLELFGDRWKVAVLRHLGTQPQGQTMNEIIGDLGIPRSSLHGVIQHCKADGLITEFVDRRHSDGRRSMIYYSLNKDLYEELAQRYVAYLRGEDVDLSAPMGDEGAPQK